MENCLLCLEKCEEFVECIKVNSEKWNQQDLKSLIEKHFWPINAISISSWMCLECSQQLQDFHKFYTRIEQTHKNLSLLVKTEHEKQISINDKGNKSIYNNLQDNCTKYGPELLMEQLMPTEFEMDITCIKSENEDEDTKMVSLKYIGKKCHMLNDASKKNIDPVKDPLEKSKNSKRIKTLQTDKRKLRLRTKKFSCSQKILSHFNNLDANEQKPYRETLESTFEVEKSKILLNPDEELDSFRNNEKKSIKSKNKRRNPDEKTLKEYDRIIADNFQIECSICLISFENFVALRKHFKMEHKRRGYARCCNRNFFTRSVLVDHIYVHLNPEHFKCADCGKVFSDRSVLENHLKLHEGDDSNLKRCDKCGKAFVNITVLRNHLLTHSSEKMFPCTICGKFFTNSSILNHHVEAVHENKFVQICEICGKSIRCPTAFASHKETHENKTTPISCDVCGLLLSNKMGLKRHKNSQHPEGGKKEHKCHICLKISPTLRALKSHIQRAHEMGYDYKCTLCEKAFKRPAVLREHMATHTGTALYNCPWCPKTFISNGNMYNHRKNAHPKEWEKLQRQKYVDKLT